MNKNYLIMFQNYFKIAWRNLSRDPQFALLNLVGLTTGLSFAVLIFLWVNDELSIDKFHEHDDRLYQVMQIYPTPEGTRVVDWTPALLAQTLQEEIPEIEYATSAKSGIFDHGILSFEDKHLRADGKLVSKHYFDVFSYPLIEGDRDKALSDKHAVIISEELAVSLFGSTEAALGKSVEWEKRGYYDYIDHFTVAGVLENVPCHSSDHFDLIFNADYYLEKDSPGSYNWGNNPLSTFVVVKEGSDVKSLDEKITRLIRSKDERIENDFFLKQYSKNYLYGNYENGVQAGGRIEYVRLFSFIAVIILIIAAINFMNLSTARATRRIIEIGVKKTMGASRGHLVVQFVSESLFLTFMALFFALMLVSFLLPRFNEITGKQLTLHFDPTLVIGFLVITVVTGLFSSSYPALYLSSFKPAKVLKGSLHSSFGEIWTRKGLVVFQFTVSVLLIISVILIQQQMNFIQSKNLGYEKDNIIRIAKEGTLKEKLEPFLEEVKKVPGVLSATNSNVEHIGNNNFSAISDWEGKVSEDPMLVNVFEVNYDYLETFGVAMKAGRSFSRKYSAETSKVILNEAAVESMGLHHPIGKTITFWGQEMQIVGVTNNFQYQSLHKKVEPCIVKLFSEARNYGDEIWIKIKSGEELAAIESVRDTYHAFNPGYPFEYKFIEEDYQSLYESERKVALIAKYFTGIVIVISCLGLFGLAAFTAQRRRKEIGIRKVLGASVAHIVSLLSGDFLKLVGLAILIATPMAWYFMRRWLDNFAYRIDIQWWVFVLAAVLAIAVAMATVSVQSVRAALANPVDSLRNE